MEQETQTTPKKRCKLLGVLQANTIPIAIVVAGLLIGAAVLLKDNGQSKVAAAQAAPAAAGAGQAKPANIDEIKTAGNPFIGNVNAPVTVAYWYDYQCPFCKQVESTIIPSLINDYVNAGKVKIVFKGFPVLGSDSQTAALAERGVWEAAPQQFYKWHAAMYEKQDGENTGWGNRQDIMALMNSLGLDEKKIDALIVAKSSTYQQALQADMDEGQAYGVTGTPSFMIGKKLIVGAVPYDQIKAAVEEVLKTK